MNPVLLQKQLRDNVSDLEQFSKDLENWGEEMKRKEESVKKEARPKPKVQKLEKKSINSPKYGKIPSKIGLTDYSKWEKFDADAECDRLEGDLEDDSELSDEIDEKAHDAAMLEKEKGNKLVKNQQWDEAIKYYTKAIELYSYDPVFFANRALCQLKKNKFFEAEEDCTLSLKLDKTYVKALQRRAAANEGLNNFEAAEYDLVQVLKFEPSNKESKTALENIRRKMGKASTSVEQRPVSKFTASRNKLEPVIQPSSKPGTSSNFESEPTTRVPIITGVKEKADIREYKPEKEKLADHNEKISIWPKNDDITLVKPIKKPPHMRSKKPLKRIQILEIDENSGKPEIPKTETKVQEPPKIIVTDKKTLQQKMEEKMSQKIFEQATKMVTFEDNVEIKKYDTDTEKMIFEDNIETKKYDDLEMAKPSSAFKIKRDQMKAALDNVSHEMAWPKPNKDTSTFKTDDLKILERNLEQENNVTIIPNIEKNANNDANLTKDGKELNQFVTPRSSVQFYNMWRDSKTPEEKFTMLRQINPAEIPNIFKESLDINIFSAILDILSTQFVENKKPVYDILINFTKVKRFSAFTMFMDSTDKNRLWKLIIHMREVELKHKEEVDDLIQKYEL